ARKTGTLLGYYRHTGSGSPYVHVGQQDLTAHVDFTSLALAGQDMGLEVTGFTNQLHFLIGLGIESTFADLDPESPQSAAMRELLRPDGMGTTYKILIQHKGMSAPQLDGLRSRPYYSIAMLFVIFDIETVFIFPWAIIFKQLGLFALIEMLVFIAILLVGYFYAWKKGALEWD